MNVSISITRDGNPITVNVDMMRKSWLGERCGYEPDPIVFALEDSEGRFPLVLSQEEQNEAIEAAESIWEANEGAQAAEERRIEAETLAFEARRERYNERFGGEL